jgi:cytochrome c peroxidase
MRRVLFVGAGLMCLATVAGSAQSSGAPPGLELDGKRLFELETFGGNGRTCQTCHSQATGTVSPEDAERRFANDPSDPLFVHDGSDDGLGHGVTRMLTDATVLITIPLPPNVILASNPGARAVVLRRGIPTTINTPALDPVIMLDGRQPSLESQAAGAVVDHAQAAIPSQANLSAIAAFQRTNGFFSSPALRRFALGTSGLCSHCHSGPLLNQTNEFADDFIGLPIPAGERFMNVGISELNVPLNPVQEFVFNPGTANERHLVSADPGRALVTGVFEELGLQHVNAFKIAPLRGLRRTAPYFHDNSAKTLEDVAAHYANFFLAVTGGLIQLTPEDQRDMVAFMKLLD